MNMILVGFYRMGGGYNIGEFSDIGQAQIAPVECVRDVPFGYPNVEIYIVDFPYCLEKEGEAIPKLHHIMCQCVVR